MDDFAIWNELLEEGQINALSDGSATPLTVLGGVPDFQITNIRILPNSQIELTWNSKPNKTYSIFWSPDLLIFGTEVKDGIPSEGDTTTHAFSDPTTLIDPPEPITTIFLRVVANP